MTTTCGQDESHELGIASPPEGSLTREERDGIAAAERRFGIQLQAVYPFSADLSSRPRTTEARNRGLMAFGDTASSLEAVFGKRIVFVTRVGNDAVAFEGVNSGETSFVTRSQACSPSSLAIIESLNALAVLVI